MGLGRAYPPVGAHTTQLAELAQLRAALPCYDVVVTSYRCEAIRRHGRTGLWCLISADAADLC
jgi:hypothetical protein